ncbi:MAG: hypothetical protein ACLFRP_07960 [Puniceicoccaceae bacterium]
MAFWLYSKNGSSYGRIRSVRLAGKDGLLAGYLRDHRSAETPFTWELDSAGLVRRIDPALAPEEHVILIDMLPESFTEVSLYRVISLRGVSEYDESDLALACKLLHQGRCPGTAGEFKEAFHSDAVESERQMIEAFRLTGGVSDGTYLWAKPGMDIGAAICPSAASGVRKPSIPSTI